MTKAFAYLRVSGKGQVEGDGFTRQLEAIKKYAAHGDIHIVKVYREEGVSGTVTKGVTKRGDKKGTYLRDERDVLDCTPKLRHAEFR